jgi:hypothetical protein
MHCATSMRSKGSLWIGGKPLMATARALRQAIRLPRGPQKQVRIQKELHGISPK